MMWDADRQFIMHALTIPRDACVLAGGQYMGSKTPAGSVVLEVAAKVVAPGWVIIQSPFMQGNARTTLFIQSITVGNGKLSYAQTMMVDIYGNMFEHTDQNKLTLSVCRCS